MPVEVYKCTVAMLQIITMERCIIVSFGETVQQMGEESAYTG